MTDGPHLSDLRPGSSFCGYRIQRQIGEGGFSEVYLATGPDRRVALKVLKHGPDGYDRPTRARFEREVRILAALRSEHVVELIDSGESNDGLLYAVFEFVEGEDLADYLRRHGPLPATEVREILRQCLRGLDTPHRQGLVHRDIKPQNIRIQAGSDQLKLLDFGIARDSADEDSVTRSGELLGTLRYMSPEQLRGETPTPASDVYSLGVVGFELLLGTDAIHGNALHEQFDRLRTGHLFTPEGAVGELWEVLERMTQQHVANRYQTAAAVLARLDNRTVREEPAAAPQRQRQVLGVILVILTAVILVVGVLVATSPETPPTNAPRSGERANVLRALPTQTAPDTGTPTADVRVGPDVSAVDATPSPGCGAAAPATPNSALEWAAPRDYDGRSARPLVVLLHDDYVPPSSLLETQHIRTFIESEDVVFVAPKSLVAQKLTPIDRFRDAWRDRERSLKVITEAVEFAHQRLCIDQSRTFVIGYGMGALGADAVKCEPWVRGVGVFAGANRSRPDLALRGCEGMHPSIWLHPTESPLLPREGGQACTRMAVDGIEETREHFERMHSCDEAGDWEPVSFGRCMTRPCATPLKFCEVRGGASWPGTRRNTAQRIHSLRCGRGLETAAHVLNVMWEYFLSQTDTL